MPLETATHISDFVTTNPDGTTDTVASLDNHIRMIKTVLQTDFPGVTGAVTATHTELNYVDGVTSAIQTQFSGVQTQLADKAPLASPTFTGTVILPATGSGSTEAVRKDYADGLAFAAALPAQTGNSGKFVTTDGTTASWAEVIASQGGNSGKFLTTNATTTSWATVTQATSANGSSLTLLATLTPTAAANVDALSTFTSSYDNYLIIGQGLLPAADTLLRMRFANAGAADTGSNYYVGTTASTSVALTSTTTTAGIGANFAITIQNANSASQIKSAIGKSESQSAATPAYTATDVGAAYVAANAVSGVRFFWNSGDNFVAQGSIRIYGYNKT